VAGRFLSIDPVLTDANTGGSFNRYVYANNSPYRYIDPDGRDSETKEPEKKEPPDKREIQIEEQLRKERERTNPGGWNVGSYLPGTEAGANAAQYWANMQVETGNSLYSVPGALASLWTPDTALATAATLITPPGMGAFAGPVVQWVRIGPSYSKSAGQAVDMSIRWGASPTGGGKYIRQIPSKTMQGLNQWLRAQRLPFGGTRSADPGHFHLW
jgi:hypothetical protein